MTSHAIEAQRQALLEQRDALLKERDTLQRELEQVRADNYDLEAEWNRLRATNAELLAALKDTVELARKAITQHGTDAEYADIRLEKALTAIDRAEGRQ
jgi:hypothetical protein